VAHQSSAEPAVGVTLIQVVEAGQRLLVDRVELALLQAQQSFQRAIVDAARMVAAGAALLGAWVALNYSLVELVTRGASRLVALLSITALHAIVGVALLARRARSCR
jgi:hypothetical protein